MREGVCHIGSLVTAWCTGIGAMSVVVSVYWSRGTCGGQCGCAENGMSVQLLTIVASSPVAPTPLPAAKFGGCCPPQKKLLIEYAGLWGLQCMPFLSYYGAQVLHTHLPIILPDFSSCLHKELDI